MSKILVNLLIVMIVMLYQSADTYYGGTTTELGRGHGGWWQAQEGEGGDTEKVMSGLR